MDGGKRGMMVVTGGPFPSRRNPRMSRPRMRSMPITSTDCSRRTSSPSITTPTSAAFPSAGSIACATRSESPRADSPPAAWSSSTRNVPTYRRSVETVSATTHRSAESADRRSLERGQDSALSNARGEPVTVVHVSAEYYPYARSGGLAEAVANLARYQSAGRVRSLAILPLYRVARKAAGPLVEVGEPLNIRLGEREETVRLFRQEDARPGTGIYFLEHDGFFDRERLYGDSRGDYPDNHLRYACFCLAALEVLPRLVSGPILLHAHDWHAALALV